MDRRGFLKTASASCVVGAAASAASQVIAGTALPHSEKREMRKPLTAYTAKDHRRRFQNIAICERGIDTCLKKHLITSYLPGRSLQILRRQSVS